MNDVNERSDTWDDEEELKAFTRIVRAFRSYAADGRCEIRRWRGQYDALSSQHQALLAHIPTKCRTAVAAVEQNQFFLNTMLEATVERNEALIGEDVASLPSSPADVEKVRYVLKNLIRDWSQEGAAERHASYTPILKALRSRYETWQLFPCPSKRRLENTSKRPRVLVPGCGLSRLVVEIAAAGFDAEGNEFSYFMLLPSSLMLNHSIGADSWTIHPWVLSTCNQISDADQLREVQLPDIDIRELMADTPGSMSMVAGDFVEVYSRDENLNAFDCVVTSFFIDTAHNVIEYLEIIFSVLKPGGYWLNLGPLLYHWVDGDTDDVSIEISLEDIQRIAEGMGFKTLYKETVAAPYLANKRAMFQTVYQAVFWTMEKLPAPT